MRQISSLPLWVSIFALTALLLLGAANASDNDSDGLDDDWESANGYDNSTYDQVVVIESSANGADSDNDGLTDSWESANGYDASNKDNPLGTKSETNRDRNIQDYQTGRYSWFTTGVFVTFVSFGIFSCAFGGFAARYGQNKSRLTGLIMLGAGVAILATFTVFSVFQLKSYPDDPILPFGIIHWSIQLILVPLASVIGAGLGALGALFFFLVVIMRS